MNKRANTDQEKEEIINRILQVWKNHPKLRLGQLIDNALTIHHERPKLDLFYIEDMDLMYKMENISLSNNHVEYDDIDEE